MASIAVLYMRFNRSDKALQLYEKEAKIRKKTLGERHP